MRLQFITCKVLQREAYFCAARSNNVVDVVLMEQGLHDEPQRLRTEVQKALDNTCDVQGRPYDASLLGYGLCSNGIVGIKVKRQPIVIPRVHDCIALFLGSHERYMEEQTKEPGTYYLTKGWIDEGKSPLGTLHEYSERYGKETAEWVIREELKNYTRIALVDVGLQLTESYQEHARENARFLNLRYEEIKGSLEFFERMLHGDWDKGFLILNPGEEVTQDLFF